MSANILQFPQPPIVLPEFHSFTVSNDVEAQTKEFRFTDERGNVITLTFGEPELGPVLDIHGPKGQLLFHLCLVALVQSEGE